MARKRTNKQKQPSMPASAPDRRKGSRHKPRKMMPLPPWLYAKLKEDARKAHRPATWQLRHIVIEALLESGTLTREELEAHQEEEEDAGS